MIETKENTIDNYKISVTQFAARRAIKLKTKILKLIGPALISLIGKAESEVNAETLLPAFESFADKLDPDTFIDLLLEILSATKVDGQDFVQMFDSEFAGKIDIVYKIVFFALKVNYESFFVKGGILTKLKTN